MSRWPLESNLLKLNLQTTLTPLPASGPRLAILAASAPFPAGWLRLLPSPLTLLMLRVLSYVSPASASLKPSLACPGPEPPARPLLRLWLLRWPFVLLVELSSRGPEHVTPLSWLTVSLLVACCLAQSLAHSQMPTFRRITAVALNACWQAPTCPP